MTDLDSPPPARRHAGRQAIIWALKIVVSGGLLYWLFSKVDAGDVWSKARAASVPWLLAALAIYFVMVLVSSWRWGLLLAAQRINVTPGMLVNSYLVATFFNNFLPSNIGGDVIRIRDTVRPAGSRTLATTVVLLDRGIGLLGLVFVAAVGVTIAARRSEAIGPIGPTALWTVLGGGILATLVAVLSPQTIGRALGPLRALHQEWVGERIERLTSALARFREEPQALVQCFVGSIGVQALLLAFYAAIARALSIPIPLGHLAILVPLASIVQMMPVSVNGLGVREQTFKLYFDGLHLPAHSAIALSLMSAALIMLFSTTGAVAYLMRREKTPSPHFSSS